MPHAEIAGCGFAGLSAGLALAQRDWSVRVHERAATVRAEGFKLSIQGNGPRVLGELGVWPGVKAGGVAITQRLTEDAQGRTTSVSRPRDHSLRVNRSHLLLPWPMRRGRQGWRC